MTTKRLGLCIAVASVAMSGTAIADDEKHKDKDTSVQSGERALDNVLFDFDSASPREDVLMVANHLQCKPNETVILDAYTDPIGSNEYNADLAQRRAEAVRDLLVEYGIDRNRIVVGVFGEQGTTRGDHALDRRVEVRTSDQPLATIVQSRRGTAVAILSATGGDLEATATP